MPAPRLSGTVALVRSVVLALVVLAAPLGVVAQDDTAAARVHFDAGTRAFDTGDYERAITEFRAAYALTEHPDILFNIYSASERAGRLEEAAAALEGYLARGAIEDDRRPVLDERLARLRDRVAAEGAVIAAETTPTPARPEEPTPPSPTPAAPSGVHPAGVGVLVGGVALLAGFAVVAGLSFAEDQSLAGSCGALRWCTADETATLNALNVTADVLWITGAALSVAGLVLLIALPPEGGEPSVALAPWASPDGAGLVARGRL